nr:uncharacterized protein LOC116774118 isoform X2 [Danaus plexippus plexippus]
MLPILYIVSLLIPYPSVQHFIWPLHWCLLADICNHTYIPECATDNEKDMYSRRLFIDECDLYEYNCDYETVHHPIPTACTYAERQKALFTNLEKEKKKNNPPDDESKYGQEDVQENPAHDNQNENNKENYS